MFVKNTGRKPDDYPVRIQKSLELKRLKKNLANQKLTFH